ncbi:hypothetical protein TNCV_92791 [Trichonephila clavipes]|nr:hypothetical protein TNCV_92791 [Trichonephila clavipes]
MTPLLSQETGSMAFSPDFCTLAFLGERRVALLPHFAYISDLLIILIDPRSIHSCQGTKQPLLAPKGSTSSLAGRAVFDSET